MFVKDLKKAYLRCLVETTQQLEVCLRRPEVDLIYLSAGAFPKEMWQELVKKVHKGSGGIGKLAGLKLPQMFRVREEGFFSDAKELLTGAGFDIFLAASPEEVLWLKEQNIPGNQIITDHSVYLFNYVAQQTLTELVGPVSSFTCCLELNHAQLRALTEKTAEADKNGALVASWELVVYGRAPLMVTAQCMRKTSTGCDGRHSWLWLKDRTGAAMPVKNDCVFCQNTIYNAVPTILFDLDKEVDAVNPDSIRYEFTVETAEETADILSKRLPAGFTRGHFHKSVE